jgi:hypothetical protein
MKQDEWEKSVSEKLRERRLPPRPELWDRIEEELGSENSSSQRRALTFHQWRWAAVFLALLGITSLFWFSNSADDGAAIEKQLVEKTLQPTNSPTIEKAESPEEVAELPVEETPVEPKVEAEFVEEIPEPVALEDLPKKEELATAFAEAPTEKVSTLEQAIEEKSKRLLEEVLALESNGNRVTDQEVDSLLRLAQAELLAERSLDRKDSLHLDPMALLAQAEYELDNDKNFRDRLYDSLKESFHKVSTAVAQRNQ